MIAGAHNARASEPRASILIVDDRPANLIAFEAVLEPLGETIVRADSGSRALALADENDFAVILMDVQMPSLDGFETTRRLRANPRTHAVPVILVTAIHGGIEWAEKGYSLGIVDYLAKPFEPEFLRAKVGAFVAWWRHREQLKRQQAALEAAEIASQAKDEFLMMVSHELRTPLAAILGWGEVLKRDPTPERTRQATRAILRSAEAQSRLVEDLLDVSRILAGKFEITRARVDLAEIVRAAIDTVQPLAVERRVIVRHDAPAPAPLDGDGERLQQIVWNLLQNAIKFSPAESRVDLTLATEHGRHVLTVRDEGIGIAADFLPHVFDRFRQADRPRRGGLGLGLSIVQHVVAAHGGTVTAASDGLGRGATFTVTLPAAS